MFVRLPLEALAAISVAPLPSITVYMVARGLRVAAGLLAGRSILCA